jgi:very-short-patch-repair endonuclease
MTPAEHTLWERVRRRALGAKFRRQHPIGPFIVDFYCPSARLAIELDGGQHFEDAQIARDAARTRYLATRSVLVLRFTNTEVMTREEDVVAEIVRMLARR